MNVIDCTFFIEDGIIKTRNQLERIICSDCHMDSRFEPDWKQNVHCVHCKRYVCSDCLPLKFNKVKCDTCASFLCNQCELLMCELVPRENESKFYCLHPIPSSCHVLVRTCWQCHFLFCPVCFCSACPNCRISIRF